MHIKLFDQSQNENRVFHPIDKYNIRIYVCGPTVYNYAHIGNGRAAIVFDLLYRVLRYYYGEANVKFARNITDIDDKIIQKAKDENKSITDITDFYKKAYLDDVKNLGAVEPDYMPCATSYIEQMEQLILKLLDHKHAYENDGHILFDIGSYADYGKFSRFDKNKLIAGSRVEIASYKKNDLDFVLWKPAKKEDVGYESKFGYGRPGWHIECSAMIKSIFGETIDIHGGGIDLKFPHHENENAQSICAHSGSKLANYWVYNGFVNMGSDKMSKSLGNIITIREALENYDGEILRFVLLSTHYRQPLEWTNEKVNEAISQLNKFYSILEDLEIDNFERSENKVNQEFLACLYDDLNTPKAFSVMHKIYNNIKNESSIEQKQNLLQELYFCGNLMGFFTKDIKKWNKGFYLRNKNETITEDEIEELIHIRKKAREEKNFRKADEIRDLLLEKDIIIEDANNETKWKRK